jgi:hypothetical protein
MAALSAACAQPMANVRGKYEDWFHGTATVLKSQQ